MNSKTIIMCFILYFVVINLVAIILTIIDKKRAIKGKYRIPENTLMLTGLFGGALAEYFVMKKIHHKTKHSKFMIGLPLEIFFHIVLIALVIYKTAF